MALTRPRGFEGQVRGVSHHGQENKTSTNRPDTLTQTFFIHKLFPCSQTADHTFEQLRFLLNTASAAVPDRHPQIEANRPFMSTIAQYPCDHRASILSRRKPISG